MVTNSKNNKKELVVESKTSNLVRIREFVYNEALSLGFTSNDCDDIVLAIDEACTNIIKHSYCLKPNNKIELKLVHDKKSLSITIIDYGEAFDFKEYQDPDLAEYHKKRKVGGLGIYLMKTLMDDVKYSNELGKCNKVTLIKNYK